MTMIEIVEDLYSKGYFLVPVHAVGPDGQTCTCAKGRNCPAAGKHPIQDGWTDPKKSREAFDELEAKGRRFNAGILVGPSGLLVVDIDHPDAALRALSAQGSHPMPNARSSTTASITGARRRR